jgi:hypothetical protein
VALIIIQINPIHTTPTYLSKINFNIIHPPTICSSYTQTHTRIFYLYNEYSQVYTNMDPYR